MQALQTYIIVVNMDTPCNWTFQQTWLIS